MHENMGATCFGASGKINWVGRRRPTFTTSYPTRLGATVMDDFAAGSYRRFCGRDFSNADLAPRPMAARKSDERIIVWHVKALRGRHECISVNFTVVIKQGSEETIFTMLLDLKGREHT